MLRINLLPAYVAQRRITRALVLVYSVAIVAVVAGLGVWYVTLVKSDAYWKDQADQAQSAMENVTTIQGNAQTVLSSLGGVKANLNFVKAVHNYNVSYIKLFQRVAFWTSPKVLYHSMALNGNTLTVEGYAPSLADLGRYLLEMYKYPNAAAVSLTTPIPGYQAANPNAPQTLTIPAGAVGHLPGYPGAVHTYTILGTKLVAVNGQGAGFPRVGGRFDPRKDGLPFTVAITLKRVPSPPAPPEQPVIVNIGGGGGAGGGFAGGGFPGGGGPSAGFAGFPPGGFPGGGGPSGPPPGFKPGGP